MHELTASLIETELKRLRVGREDILSRIARIEEERAEEETRLKSVEGAIIHLENDKAKL